MVLSKRSGKNLQFDEDHVTEYIRGFDMKCCCSIMKRKKDLSYVQAMGVMGLCFRSITNSHGMRPVFTI